MDNIDRREMHNMTTDQPIALRYDFDHGLTSPSTALIEALASVKNTDPVGLSVEEGLTLGEHIDTDALDRLLSDGRAGSIASVTLSIDGYTVRIQEDAVVVMSAAS